MLFLYIIKVSWLLMIHYDFIKLLSRFQSSNAVFCTYSIKINMFSLLIFFSLLNIFRSISDLLTTWSSACKQFISFILFTSQILFETYESCLIISFCSYITLNNVFAHVEYFILYFLINSSIIKEYMKFLIDHQCFLFSSDNIISIFSCLLRFQTYETNLLMWMIYFFQMIEMTVSWCEV